MILIGGVLLFVLKMKMKEYQPQTQLISRAPRNALSIWLCSGTFFFFFLPLRPKMVVAKAARSFAAIEELVITKNYHAAIKLCTQELVATQVRFVVHQCFHHRSVLGKLGT
jgi:hypothetical protein